jgi:hypothetical protein
LSLSSSITAARVVALALFALSGVAVVAQVEAGKPVDVKSAAAAAAKEKTTTGVKEKTTTAAKEKGTTAANEKAAAANKEKARKGTAPSKDVKKLVEQLSTERDTLIADHAELVKQLKDATEERKKEIIAKIEAQKKAFEEVTSALHKEIRDEQRKHRATSGKR